MDALKIIIVLNMMLSFPKAFTQNFRASNNITGKEYTGSMTGKVSKRQKQEILKTENLQNLFQRFYPLSENGVYRVKLCGDVPDNAHPGKVHLGDETGHVFIIFSKDGSEDCDLSFGFYPRTAITSLFFKKVRSLVLPSYSREYDVSISREISVEEFNLLIQKAIELSRNKYDMKKYNCYDYALDIFNAIPEIERVKKSSTKFPFLFGKGGSPCSLYRDLKYLNNKSSFWKGAIHFGSFKSPANCTN